MEEGVERLRRHCPVFPGRHYLDWQLDDLAGQGVDAVRPICYEIRYRIEKLIAELTTARSSTSSRQNDHLPTRSQASS